MTHVYKATRYLLLLIFASAAGQLHAQTTGNWQLGLGIGSTNYYGDLSPYRINGLKNIGRLLDYNKYYIDQPSFTVLVHKKLTPTLGFMIQANNLQFGMSDRYRKKNGSIDTSARNYSRSLNFRTTLQDAGIAFTFSPNNGRIGPEDVFFYPSFYVGVGVSKFTVKGDLYDENNNPYNYRLPGNIMDGTYETNLRDVRTETESKFRNVEPYVDLGLALNFRISQALTIALQSDIKYSASDYLDDVSMKYKTSYATPAEAYAAKPGYNTVDPLTLKRGDDNGMNDFYINNRVVLNIALSKKAPPKKFNPPVIYSLNVPYVQQKKNQEVQKKTADSILQVKSDSLLKIKRDSLMRDSIALKQSVQVRTDTNVQNQLNAITAQLQQIQALLRDQQVTPRVQRLQYQSDSVKAQKNRILAQRSISREDNLRLRIYDLQIDSLRNEMGRLNLNSQNPARSSDSAFNYYNRPDAGDQPVSSNTSEVTNAQNLREAVAVDSATQADVKAWENEVKDLKRDKRYKSDAGYKKNVDSLQNKLNDYQQRIKTATVNNNKNSAAAARSQQAGDEAARQRAEAQDRLDSLQRRLERIERTSADSASATTVNSIDSLRSSIARDSVADEAALNELKRRQQVRADSVALLRRQLERSADSLNYYRQQVPVSPDTVQVKRKWYQNLFRSNKKKKQVSVVNEPANAEAYSKEADQYNEEIESTRRRIEQLQNDSLAEANASRQNQKFSDQQITRLQEQLQHNRDSVDLVRRQLQRSSDSAAYYRSLIAAQEAAPEERQQAKWYQDLFTSEKKMKKKRESESTQRNRVAEQERYYDNESVDLRRRIEELENRNRDLARDYETLNTGRERATRINDVSRPVVVYDNNRNNRTDPDNTSEISALRNEIERLRSQVTSNNVNAAQPVIIPQVQVPVAPVTAAPAQPAADSSQVNDLRSELSAIRNQLDSLRNYRAPVAVEKPVQKEASFDPSSFPVTSVYFRMGAVTLPQDQINRMLPFGRVAAKNSNTNIVLKGFTDPVGNPATNASIASKRTEFVRSLLVNRFKIDQSRISVEEPEVSEPSKTKKPNPLDRRVDMNLTN